MLTGHLLQAGRILAGLTIADCSARASVTPAELEALEAKGASPLAPTDKAAAAARAVLEQSGITFLSEGGQGVLLRPAGAVDEGMRPEALNAENDD